MENILLILFALFLGYMLNRLNIMQRDGSIALNKFVLYVSYPAIVLLQTPKISFSLELMIPAIVAWTVMTLSAFLILFLLVKIVKNHLTNYLAALHIFS